MKTIVKVTVELEINHFPSLKGHALQRLAMDHYHYCDVDGDFSGHGPYSVNELRRWAQIKPEVKDEQT